MGGKRVAERRARPVARASCQVASPRVITAAIRGPIASQISVQNSAPWAPSARWCQSPYPSLRRRASL